MDEEDILSQDKIAQEVEKHRVDTEKQINKVLRRILLKPKNILTVEEIGFLKARKSYLSETDRKEYSDLLDQSTKKPTIYDLTRSELYAEALKLGIVSPEKLPNKDAVIKAIQEKEAENKTLE
jgi:hypothetical protein